MHTNRVALVLSVHSSPSTGEAGAELDRWLFRSASVRSFVTVANVDGLSPVLVFVS